jgi:prevent-host-death family protein
MTRKWMSWLSPARRASPPRPTAAYYNTHEAKNSLSKLLRRVRGGEVIVIAHAGFPVAKLVPFDGTVETRPGVVRLSVYVDDESEPPTPTQSSPAASTSHREQLD